MADHLLPHPASDSHNHNKALGGTGRSIFREEGLKRPAQPTHEGARPVNSDSSHGNGHINGRKTCIGRLMAS